MLFQMKDTSTNFEFFARMYVENRFNDDPRGRGCVGESGGAWGGGRAWSGLKNVHRVVFVCGW